MRVNGLMWRMLAGAAVSAMLAGCGGMGFSGTSATLPPIEYQYVYAMQTYSLSMNITPDGGVEALEVTGAKRSDRKSAEARLSPAQKSEILAAFQGWKNLKHTYPAYFGPIITITYDGYRVEAADSNSAAPEVKNAARALDRVAKEIITAAAPPASQPATMPGADSAAPAAGQ